MTTVRQNVALGPRGLIMPLRRDCPEILLPALAVTTGITAAASDTYGSFTNIVTAAQFGSRPLTIAGVLVMFITTFTTTVDIAGVANREGRLQLAHGAAQTVIAEVPFAGAASINLVGLGVGTCTVNGRYSELISISPVGLQPGIIAARATVNDAAGDYAMAAMPIAYDTEKLNLARSLAPDLILYRGDTPARSTVTNYATPTPAVAPANGAYVDFTVGGLAILDADYYVRGAIMSQDPTVTPRIVNYDFSVLPSGGVAGQDEAVQSRGAQLRNAVGTTTSPFIFPGGPFVAYRGETLRVRAQRTTDVASTKTMLLLDKINAY